jgi:putative N-acetylmannosamine-6-phosphate epimerase
MYAVDKIKQQMTERHVIFDQVNELIARIRLGHVWIMRDCAGLDDGITYRRIWRRSHRP